MLAVLLALVAGDFSLDAGYYSLAELADKLTEAGPHRVTAAPLCANDLYAVRLERTSLDEVFDALKATGRIEVKKSEDTWVIEPDPAHGATSEAVTKYIRQQQKRLVGDYFGALLAHISNLRATYGDGVTLYDRLRKSADGDPMKMRIANALYLYASNETPYAALSIPNTVSAQSGGMPLTLKWVNAASHPEAFTDSVSLESDSYWRSLFSGARTPLELQELAKACQGGVKFGFDPFTYVAGVRTVFSVKSKVMSANYRLAGPETIGSVLVDLREVPLFSGPAEERVIESKVVKTEEPCVLKHPSKSASARVTRALLDWADTGKTSLVAYVGLFSDLVVEQGPETSLGDLVDDANAGSYDPKYTENRLLDRGLYSREAAGRTMLTVLKAGPVVVVRDEFDFRDSFSPNVAPSVLKDLYSLPTDFKTRVNKVVSLVAGLSLKTWVSSAFPEQFTGVCNPVNFLPFARLLSRNSAMAAKVRDLGNGAEVGLNRFNLAEARAVLEAVREAAPLVDNVAGCDGEPALAANLIEAATVHAQSINVHRQGDVCTFELRLNGSCIWRAVLRS